eukprot:Skav205881  [mRNA]  locus=scaffold766:333886:334653:+ [translate_table: standard]
MEEALYLAELAESAGRFDDMAWHMKSFVEERFKEHEEHEDQREGLHSKSDAKEGTDDRSDSDILSERERNLFIAAYKAALSSRRSAWQATKNALLQALKEKEDRVEKFHVQPFHVDKAICAREYHSKLTAEVEKICYEVLEMLRQLVLRTRGSTNMVLYHKMQGDYYRHLAEVQEGAAREKAIRISCWKYDQAEILAERDLEITNPIRLAVTLNYSVLIAETDQRSARRKAERVYDAAIQQLDLIPEERGTYGGK